MSEQYPPQNNYPPQQEPGGYPGYPEQPMYQQPYYQPQQQPPLPVDSNFWVAALKQLGVGIVFAVMLVIFYTHEQNKWDANAETEQKRWEQLFQQYVDDNKRSLDAIKACCYETQERLIKSSRGGI
ncbi:MAG: hypothetical protein WCS18_05225 [Sphaerochaetaceae bacterium]